MLISTGVAGTILGALVAFAALAPCTTTGQETTAGGTPSTGAVVSIVARGLANPRGFAFDPEGVLHVAVAGGLGSNAGVVAIEDGCPRAVASGFPNARVAFGVSGVADVGFHDGQAYALYAGGDIDRGGPPNGLYRLDGAGGMELVADISGFIRDNPVAERPGDYDTDGQPYALLPVGDGFLATEGNSNQVLRLGLDGTVERIADLSRGHPIPTGIAPAPGGSAYVALFGHAPYAEGAGRVIEIAPDGSVSEVWTGLTLPTALALGPDGALYAAQMATGIDPDDPASIAPGTGSIVRRNAAGTVETVVTALSFPVAMKFGPDGALYVASPAFGADDGQGTVTRVDLAAGTQVVAPTDGAESPPCP